nr:RNA-directed DNA polymerase, eukaryota [Tanacetum cinerariifolium]
VTLVDTEGKPLAKAASSGDHESEDEVTSVDNEIANFLASRRTVFLLGLIRFMEKTVKLIHGENVANKMSHSRLASSLRRNPRGGDGEFSVASVRNLIDGRSLAEVGAKTCWIKYVLIKVNILAWRIKLNNLPSRLSLSRRGSDLDTIFCPSCNSAVESSNHIFFGCPMEDINVAISENLKISESSRHVEIGKLYELWQNRTAAIASGNYPEEADQIISKLHHANIIPFYSKNGPYKEYAIIGRLNDYLEEEKNRRAKGLSYLHS